MPPSQSAWQQESVDHWRARRPSRLLSRSLQRPGGLCDADDDGGAVVDDDDGHVDADDDGGHCDADHCDGAACHFVWTHLHRAVYAMLLP